MPITFSRLFCLAVFVVCLPTLRAGTAAASGISGLYYTGVDSSGNLLSVPTEWSEVRDSHWSVTYASVNGGTSQAAQYQGAGYVVHPIDGGWISNTSDAQWITAPSATKSSGTNIGGDNLPGNGTGNNMGVYVYTLAFTITSSDSKAKSGDTVSNNMAISLTIAADDQFQIYLNPTGNGTTNPSGTALFTGNGAWGNTTAFTLSNFGANKNTSFLIGTNYLVIEVDNTNSLTGDTTTNPTNPSGMLFYQTGSQFVSIGGSNYDVVAGSTMKIVPEVGVAIPAAGVVGLLGFMGLRRRKRQLSSASIKACS